MRHVWNRAGRVAILLLPIALGACAQYGAMNTSASTGPRTFAWDGAGEDPNLPRPAHRRTASASRAPEPAIGEETGSAEADRNLASKLVICSGCIKRPEPSDQSDPARLASR